MSPVNSFTKRLDPAANAIKTDCRVSTSWFPAPDTEPPKSHEAVGIWDTGATGSAISKNVVEKCGLKTVGYAEIRTANGLITAERHLVNLHLPNGVVFAALIVNALDLGDVDVLIGMDVMKMGDFAVTNFDGPMTVSFRMPSQETIDFVKATRA